MPRALRFEMWLSARIDFDLHGSCQILRINLYIGSAKTEAFEVAFRFIAKVILADAAGDDALISQIDSSYKRNLPERRQAAGHLGKYPRAVRRAPPS